MLPVMVGVFLEWLPWVVNIVSATVVTERFVVCFPNAKTKHNHTFLLPLQNSTLWYEIKSHKFSRIFLDPLDFLTLFFFSLSCFSIHSLGNIILPVKDGVVWERLLWVAIVVCFLNAETKSNETFYFYFWFSLLRMVLFKILSFSRIKKFCALNCHSKKNTIQEIYMYEQINTY